MPNDDREIVAAFRALHAAWLVAQHRADMNSEMDALARALGLDPYTLELKSPQDI